MYRKDVIFMKYSIKARVSNRHVHLTKEVYEKLFDEEMNVLYKLNQIGEFASDKTLTLKVGTKIIENVRVCGPYRSYNQVELSKKDARFLNIEPPVRRSGDLEGAEEVILETEKGEVSVCGAIIMMPHVHMNSSDAQKYSVQDKEIVQIKFPGPRSGSIDAEVKISDNGYYELHLDTDESNAFLVEDNMEVTMITKE